MNLLSVKTIKEVLLTRGIKPSKRLGQNFLVSKTALGEIIAVADLKPSDIVLEIGSGAGTLTQELAKKAKRVIAVEKDPSMVEVLKETLKNFKNVDIINSDILKINFQLLKKYKVVANLPYYITSHLIRKLLESENPPETMVLMVQKEVAQRICASPPKMSLLSVAVQFYASSPHQNSKGISGVGTGPKIIAYVKKESFWPKPKVDSAIIKITPRTNARDKQINADLFFKVVKAGFSQPRKQLANNLSKTLGKSREEINQWLLKNGIKPEQRAETLSVEDWEKLTKP